MGADKAPSIGLTMKHRSVGELRALASEFLQELPPGEVQQTGKQNLIIQLTERTEENGVLAERLLSEGISIKPSFYLLTTNVEEEFVPEQEEIIRRLEGSVSRLNSGFDREKASVYKGFRLEQSEVLEADLYQAQFAWQQIHWYWEPQKVTLEHIYELRLGYFILDAANNKAICTCHTEKERKYLCQFMGDAFDVGFSPMILTKPLLDQVGTFDQVKRASYSLERKTALQPSNVIYADEELPLFPAVREREDDFNSKRVSSFYRIPLGSIEQQGIGVTSNSGKLWIPRETSIEAVSEYGVHLLRRVRSTLDKMSADGRYQEVLDTFGIESQKAFANIKDKSLRVELVTLLFEIANMILSGEKEKPFSVSLELASKGVSASLFNEARLQLHDPDSDEIGYWQNADGSSPFVRIKNESGDPVAYSWKDKTKIDLANLQHPLTGRPVSIESPLDHLQLIPTPKLESAMLEAMEHLSGQFEKLGHVEDLLFHISSQVISLDLDSALGRTPSKDVVLQLAAFQQFDKVKDTPVPVAERNQLRKRLRFLGEKCKFESDDNCLSCVEDRNYLCLRSLVGTHFKNPVIYMHKSIELSDMQGDLVTLEGDSLHAYCFAKLSPGEKGTLTVRNDNGAVLLAQILGQIDRGNLDLVVVISPSSVQEDLRERIELICKVFSKKLLILDSVQLSKILLDFEDDYGFEEDVEELYKRSNPNKKVPL
jgi:acyl carrier protein